MDLDNLPAELERAKSKIAKIDERKERASGWGATTSGQAIVRRYHDRVTEGFRIALLDAHSGMKSEAELVVLLRGLPPELLALLSIQGILRAVRGDMTQTGMLVMLGEAVAAECWAAKLTLDLTGTAQRIAKAVKLRHSSVDRRQSAMKRRINKAVVDNKINRSFKAREWKQDAHLIAGAWLCNVVTGSIPEVFTRRLVTEGRHKTTTSLELSEHAWGIVKECMDLAMLNNPIYWPMKEQPKPWTDWRDGGAWDPRVSAKLLRSHHKETQGAVKHAIRSGQMQPALDALNQLQATPYQINYRVLEVLEKCDELRLKVDGIVPDNLPKLEKPNAFAWEAMDKQQKAIWFADRAAVEEHNRGLLGERILFAEDITIAYKMLEHKTFYTPMNMDWRGRVYGLCHFSFQRDDRVRALFLFDQGMPIGEDGLRWLKIHTANCGDFGKISKRPLEERVTWCDTNGQMITNIASDPLAHTEWMGADKPFLFLAACFELSMALAQGSSFITHLPTSYDGSCSGLQHLCAMTRAPEGSMVNLTSSETPQDIYQVIADDTFAAVAADTENAELAELFLEYPGDRRKLAKRNVMTYAYSSKKFGMAAQQQTDLMDALTADLLGGKLAEHPFEGYQNGPYDKHGVQQPSKACRYIAGHIYDAIERRINKPAEAMEFLQKIAKAMAHEGKPARWTTPVGLPWINRYHPPIIGRVRLFLNDGGIRKEAHLSLRTGEEKEINKAKAANGIAPNFVHALDAAHLLLSVSAAAAAGITSIATVHDSFGCLAPQAGAFNRIIREQFALMYENNDVLAQILEQASADLTDANRNRLPTIPERGTLDIKEILNAAFAFA